MAKITDSYPCNDGFYMPAEYGLHDGTIMIYPIRPGSWGKDRTGAVKAFSRIFLEIIKRENLYILTDKEHLNEVKNLMDAVITDAVTGEGDSPCTPEEGKRILDEMEYCYRNYDGVYTLSDVLEDRCLILPIESDDAWARDVGPTFVVKKDSHGDDNEANIRGISWKFNAWGGEVDGLYASWDKDNKVAEKFCDLCEIDFYDAEPFVLEGGSIHTDGSGTVMVTQSCLLSGGRNPDLSKPEIEEKLKKYLGCEKVLWLPRGIYNDETNEHVDNVCAFIAPGEAVLAWTDNENDPQYELSMADLLYLQDEVDAEGNKIKVHKLPIPDHPVTVTEKDLANYEFEEGEDVREVGERLAASYVNFYYINGAVLVPQFGGDNKESDERALNIFKEICPDREVIGIPARDILLGGGNIHCITQQIPANNLGQ